MLGTIFKFETKRWFKNWQFYLYFILFFALSFSVMASVLGYFDAFTATTVYRDYKYNSHTLLFAYPFNKFQYLTGKFLSGFFVTILITLSIGLAFLVASVLPFANQDLLGPVKLGAYFQSYLLFVVPNIFFVGALIFMLVTLTRNQYIGFIFVIVLMLAQGLIGNLTNNVDDKFVASLFEPYGNDALFYVTQYWTIEEQNTLMIPLEKAIVLNRLIWLGVGILALAGTYFAFSFSQAPLTLGRKKKGNRVTKNNFGSIIKINLPKVAYDFSFISYLKTAFRLSKFEFKTIVSNWIFVILMLILLMFIVISGYTLGQGLYGTRTYPVTWQVINLINGFIGIFLSILIYLFSGILLNNPASSRMNLLVDSTAVPNWSWLLSKWIALLDR